MNGRQVNRNLRKRNFRMETLQREGHQLFERRQYDGTVEISCAYHHIEMAGTATPFLGFEWEGMFHCFDMLPIGLLSAPRLFTAVMGRCARFLRYTGVDLICYLDDVIFGAGSAREALQSAYQVLRNRKHFVRLIHPTKGVWVSSAVQIFAALGTLVDLTTQTYPVPAATVDRILSGLAALTTGGPSVGVRLRVAGPHQGPYRLHVGHYWRRHAGADARDGSGHGVPGPGYGQSRHEGRASWAGAVTPTAACLDCW